MAHHSPTVLLLGGTCETAPLAAQLAARGLAVVVSRATDAALAIGEHPRVQVRSGPLDEAALAALLAERGVGALVDATHPYAAAIRALAVRVAAARGVPYYRLQRAESVAGDTPGVTVVGDHAAAARAAFAFGRPVLLTTGSRNLAAYVEESRRTGVPLWARVLDHLDSQAACLAAGVSPDRVLVGRGPYSVETNREQIRRHCIGVLVTKDSGAAGGVPEKLAAARAEGCAVVVVARPGDQPENAFDEVGRLVEAVVAALAGSE